MRLLKPFASSLVCLLAAPVFAQGLQSSDAGSTDTKKQAETLASDVKVGGALSGAQSSPEPEEPVAGFFPDAHLTISTRNFFTNQYAQRTTRMVIQKDSGNEPTRRRDTWLQSANLDFRSGFTQGLVGIGVDATLFNVITLERGHGIVANGGDRVLVDGDGDSVSTWSKLGVANLKVKFSDTNIAAGRFTSDLPILRSKDNRVVPATFQGVRFVSNEVNNITVQGGSITRTVPRTSTDSQELLSTFGNRTVHGDRQSYIGLSVAPQHGLSGSLYYSRFEDVWNQYYLGLTDVTNFNDGWSLKNSFNAYHTSDQGSRQLGYIDNTAASFATTVGRGANSVTLAYQQVFGNEYFDYLWETASNNMANSAYSDYNGPNEKSVQLRYDLNAAGYGIPGLTFTLWHIRGWGIDGTHYDGDRNGANMGYNVRKLDGDKQWEVGASAAYVIQSGSWKNASIRTTVYHHRATANQIDGSWDEFRVVTSIPFEIF